MNKRVFFAVLNSGSPTVGEIKIYGFIGSYWDENTANDFTRAFSALEKTCERINVHINSPGGSVWEGLPISNAIKASKREVHTYVDGIAYSMGAMIAISAPKGRRHMATGSLLMLHSVSTVIYGNAQALREEADVLDKYDDVLGAMISSATGKSIDDVKSEYLDHKDHYFTPEEAVAEGLADIIENYSATETPDNVKNMSYGQVAAWYEGQTEEPTENMIMKVANKVRSFFNDEKTNKENMFGNKFSKLGGLAKVAVASITAAQMEDINAEIVAAGIEGVTVVLDSELESVSNDLATIKAEKSNLEAEKATLDADLTTKENRIQELEAEINALKGKPAEESGSPASKGDNIPSGDGKVEQVDNFETEFDREAASIFNK
ncbi:head maturation protease, ClpP-related [Sphingobacterium spiritivorum]|uniref:head maturation protease, ClpP-related n=1 Tax=Sphingobacterium spiritivorum TaxID=258 RepID=UPI003DA233E6